MHVVCAVGADSFEVAVSGDHGSDEVAFDECPVAFEYVCQLAEGGLLAFGERVGFAPCVLAFGVGVGFAVEDDAAAGGFDPLFFGGECFAFLFAECACSFGGDAVAWEGPGCAEEVADSRALSFEDADGVFFAADFVFVDPEVGQVLFDELVVFVHPKCPCGDKDGFALFHVSLFELCNERELGGVEGTCLAKGVKRADEQVWREKEAFGHDVGGA